MSRIINKIALVSLVQMLLLACNPQFEKTTSNKELVSLLCHKWVINPNENLSVKEVFPPELYSTVEFDLEGTVTFNSINPNKGTWEYKKDKKILIINLNGRVDNYKILEINEMEMVLESLKNGTIEKSLLTKIE